MGSRFWAPYTELLCSGVCLEFRHFDPWNLTTGTKGLENTTSNKVFCRSVARRDYHTHTLHDLRVMVASSLVLSLGWAGVTIMKSLPQLVCSPWAGLSLAQSGTEWTSFWTRSDVHTSLDCYLNITSIAIRRFSILEVCVFSLPIAGVVGSVT